MATAAAGIHPELARPHQDPSRAAVAVRSWPRPCRGSLRTAAADRFSGNSSLAVRSCLAEFHLNPKARQLAALSGHSPSCFAAATFCQRGWPNDRDHPFAAQGSWACSGLHHRNLPSAAGTRQTFSQFISHAGRRNCEIPVGVTGFEPATSCSQSRRATKLRYTPVEGA